MSNEASQGKEFLGAGIAFPLRLEQGRMAIDSLEDRIRQSILLILQTAKGDRVMHPDFGSGLRNLVFAPITATTTALVEHEVKDALIRFEPRIDVLDVAVTADPQQQGLLLIDIEYRVRQTDTLFNLVYPFYLERGEL
jgi:uncharacterized protein